MTTDRKTRTITLTGRAPVRIIEEDWPVIADASIYRFLGQSRDVRIRRHADGRTIVYGTAPSGRRARRSAAGILLAAAESRDIAAAIRIVCIDLGAPELAQRLIADLPAVAI